MRWIFLSVLLVVSGCASTNQFVPRPETTQVNPGKVIVQVKRPVQWYGNENPFVVRDNGQVIGNLGPGGELLWERDPGEMSLTVKLEFFKVNEFRPFKLETTAGERYEFEATLPYWPPVPKTIVEQVNAK